ncbi:hypothetical protein C0075_01925 [Rhizobium sp. KAs_5_22]|nr:hypothetical protein C0075_01925 [Rhizobium sp. KAs_5_22]
MKRSRFTGEQIIGVLKEQGEPWRTAQRQSMSAASTAFRMRPYTNSEPLEAPLVQAQWRMRSMAALTVKRKSK